MIQIIAGREGAGKTKNLIDMANDLTKVTDGHIVYVDADNSHIYHLSHQIRLIKPDELPSIDNGILWICLRDFVPRL